MLSHNIKIKNKFALISSTLPPSSSGQAFTLFRLLSKIEKKYYCLISQNQIEMKEKNYDNTRKLNCNYYRIQPILNITNPKKLGGLLNFIINFIVGSFFLYKMNIEKILKKEKCKIIVLCTGDFFLLWAIYLLNKKNRYPYIIYIFDDFIYQWSRSHIFYRIFSKYIWPRILLQAKNVIVMNEFAQKEYKQKYNISSKIVRNPIPNIEKFESNLKEITKSEIQIIYGGSISKAHFDSIKNLVSSLNKMDNKNIRFYIYTNNSKKELMTNGICGKYVIIKSYVSQKQMFKKYREASILFLPLSFNSFDQNYINTASPSKIGEYLVMGRPILVHAPKESFTSWFFTKNNCGYVVDDNNIDKLINGINELIMNKALIIQIIANARRQAKKQFNIEINQRRFIKILK
jgi:glycosyltransferase involved in cell wall biosynthesis